MLRSASLKGRKIQISLQLPDCDLTWRVPSIAHWTLKVVLAWFNDFWKFVFRNWLLDPESQINVWKKKKIAKVFILSLMSTHDFWNVHIHTQQSKLLQNKQWKKENIYQLRQSKFDHKFKNPKINGNFSCFVGNFYVHNSNAILISPKNCMVQNSALKSIWSLSFLNCLP